MVLARPDERETCPYHFSLHLFTMVRRSSRDPIACWILAHTSSVVTWSLYELRSILHHCTHRNKDFISVISAEVYFHESASAVRRRFGNGSGDRRKKGGTQKVRVRGSFCAVRCGEAARNSMEPFTPRPLGVFICLCVVVFRCYRCQAANPP